MSSQQFRQRIRLKKKVNEVQIEVWISDEKEFRESYALLTRLCERAEIEDMRQHLEFVWIRNVEGKRLNDYVTEGVHRVALFLFEDYPESKSVSSIQNETGLFQGFVSNIISGRRGSVGNWFEKKGESWILSQTGKNRLIFDVIPTIIRGVGSENE